MNLLHDYSIDQHRVDAFGGEAALQHIKQYIETIEASPCPFCGHRASMALQSQYGTPAVAIECIYCHCRTTTIAPSYNYLSGEFSDIYEAVRSVASRWNRRKEGGAGPQHDYISHHGGSVYCISGGRNGPKL